MLWVGDEESGFLAQLPWLGGLVLLRVWYSAGWWMGFDSEHGVEVSLEASTPEAAKAEALGVVRGWALRLLRACEGRQTVTESPEEKT